MTVTSSGEERTAMAPAGEIRRVGIVFSGGPAPAANAVISACALSFLDQGVEVVGILDGFLHIGAFKAGDTLVEGQHFVRLGVSDVSGIRNRKSVMLRTSHADPARGIENEADLLDPARNAAVVSVLAAVGSLGLDGLVTVGGDETLCTANHLCRYQQLVPGTRPLAVVHLPKTIDNDYNGIDWTFGFVSAADFAAHEIRNLGADAQSTNTWYVLELMGRQAGWLTYAAGIAGEATRMLSVEDVDGTFDLDSYAAELASLMLQREAVGKRYGIVCVAEGLASHLATDAAGVDGSGYSLLGAAHIADRIARATEDAYERACGRAMRVRSKQIGYEARCAEPVAFDILLGSQLGVGAYRALAELGKSGHMVSVRDQFELVYLPFEDLVDPVTLRTRVRLISRDSDFYKLARALEYHGRDADSAR
jgi:ATP-dependent phosphofructokinase / diphosphate-dependent phosphofructokinase